MFIHINIFKIRKWSTFFLGNFTVTHQKTDDINIPIYDIWDVYSIFLNRVPRCSPVPAKLYLVVLMDSRLQGASSAAK